MAMTRWRDHRSQRATDPAVAAGYERARRAYELGRQIRERREAAGLSQRALAKRAGTSQATIASLEAGGQEPRISTLDRIGEVLGLRVEVVLTV
jgi:DNA-binding XRE family transcriptional regulator